MLNWNYATRNHKLIPEDYSKERIAIGKKNVLVFIIVSVIAVIIGIFTPENSGWTFLLIPILKVAT